ncbi:hypothetical protein [Stenotrophomonas indicatrix]|uniref:hypothetical protein n=1 Tax=Stenotrophomonas indicatrix TaxID=2045451 RepID=UPI0024340CCD|nr:hypothetical protein [Stenotrophomonas indicatrix]
MQGNLSAGNTLSLDSAGDILLEAGKAHVADRSKSSNAGPKWAWALWWARRRACMCMPKPAWAAARRTRTATLGRTPR